MMALQQAKEQPIEPTAEQMRHGQFVYEPTHDKLPGGRQITIGKAYRRRPMVDILAAQSLFSDAEYKALQQYRHYASLADRSLVRDSLNKMRGAGNPDGPTVEMLTAIQITTACEREAGQLRGILRAVIVNDMSLSQWAIEQGGGIEKCRDRKAKRVCVIEPKVSALRIAQLEIKMAAKRVEAEIGA